MTERNPHPGTTGGSKRQKLRVDGVMDSSTIAKLHELIGAPQYAMLYEKTWLYLGKWLNLSGRFTGTKREVRMLQRKLGMTYPNVNGRWFNPETGVYDPKTTAALQRYINEVLT